MQYCLLGMNCEARVNAGKRREKWTTAIAASWSSPVTEQVDGFIGADWLDTDISGSHMLQVTRS